MRKTLIFVAVTLGLGLALPAMADDNSNQNNRNKGSITSSNTNSSTHSKTVTITPTTTITPSGDDRNNSGDVYSDGMGTSAANNGATATSTVNDAFNTSEAVANTNLNGYVSNVQEIGRAHV